MKSFKTILIGTIVAGLLLFSVNSAMAAYTGLYEHTAGSSPVNWVTLNSDSFEFSAMKYDVTKLGSTFWAAKGASDYFYGANLSDGFGFINSPTALGPSAVSTINASVSSFIGSSMIAVQAFQASPVFAEILYGGDLQSVLTGYAQNLLTELGGYNLTGASIGYGYFYDNGDKFDVSLGSLDEAGLVALFEGADVNTYTATPIPAAIWLLGSGLVGLVGLRRRMRG